MSLSKTIITRLRQRGYRITPQREMIVDIIAHSERHISAEKIFEELQAHTHATNIATVYRTLDMLWEEGFTRRSDLGKGWVVYAPFEHGPHVHLVCRHCNRVIEAGPQVLETLDEGLRANYDFAADLQHISIFGLCADCQKSS
jgi:Fur family ferric uptake transcriptional regulator